VALTSAQIKGLSTTTLSRFATDDLSAMTTTQFAVFTTVQLNGLTSEQFNALSNPQLEIIGTATPLVLDLNGDGVKTLSITNGIKFDLNANGLSETVGWVSPQDGLLAVDLNSDGLINDGSELFGSSTVLENGNKASNGFEALAGFDSNKDGHVDLNDEKFNNLMVWTDANSDGKSESAELKSLLDLGINSISLVVAETNSVDNGNQVKLASTYDTNNVHNNQIVDVWFKSSEAELANSVTELTNLIHSNEASTFAETEQKISDSSSTSQLKASADQLSLVLNENSVNNLQQQFTSVGSKLNGNNELINTKVAIFISEK